MNGKYFNKCTILFLLLIVNTAFGKTYNINNALEAQTIINYADNTSVEQMDVVTFGEYQKNDVKEPIEWIVLEKQADRVLLLSKDLLDISDISSEWSINENFEKYNPNVRLQQIKSDYDYKNVDDMKLYLNYAKEFYKAKNDYIANNFLIAAFSQEELNNIIDTNMNTKINEFVYVDEWASDYSYFNENLIYSNVLSVLENNKVFQLSVEEYDKYLKTNVMRQCDYSSVGDESWQTIFYESRDYYISNRGFFSETRDPSIVYEAKTGIKYDDAGNVCIDTSYEIGYRPAIWVKVSSNNSINETIPQTINYEAINNYGTNMINTLDAKNNSYSDLTVAIEKAKAVTEYPNGTLSMDTVTFGKYPQADDSEDPIEWYVLEKDINNHRALLFSKNILMTDIYYNRTKEKITYEGSTVRRVLNNNFYDKAFDSSEKELIQKTINKNKSNSKYDNDGGNDTEDYVFLLSEEEIRKYFNITKKLEADIIDERIYAPATMYSGYENRDGNVKYPKSFWLRSPGRFKDRAQLVNQINLTGIYLDLNGDDVDMEYGIRPAIWVNYDSNEEQTLQNANIEYNTNIRDNTNIESNTNIENNINIENKETIDTYNNQNYFIQNDNIVDEEVDFEKFLDSLSINNQPKEMNKVYYYVKHDNLNNIITSINTKNTKDGILGTGLFSKTKRTYNNIIIDFNDIARKKLSEYAESEWNGSYHVGKDWVLLAGNSMDELENLGGLGISPYRETDSLKETEGMSFYQKGKLQINCSSENEQKNIYNKLKKAKVILLATNNVIKSYKTNYYAEEKLGNVERFEYVEDDGSHINLVTAYVDCEDAIINYTKNHGGYFLYIKDGFSGKQIYHEEIVSPKKECKKFDVLVFANDSMSYAIYGNKVNYLAGKEVGGMKKFEIFGGKIMWEFELDTKNGFYNYDEYYKKYNPY